MRWIRIFLFLLIAVLIFGFSSAQFSSDNSSSKWIHFGSNGKLVYKKTPAGDKIMDYSFAGYMGGGVALPDVPVKLKVKPSEGNDDSHLIQSAINKVSRMPVINGFRGAILLSPGIYTCSETISITSNGIVLRGSGSGKNGTTIKMEGGKHTAIIVGRKERLRYSDNNALQTSQTKTTISDTYVPSGSMHFNVVDASGFSAGDYIEIRKPVTEAWIKFMKMDNLVRDGHRQTWLKTGTYISTKRRIVSVSGRTITVNIPLTDSFNSKYLNPPGTSVIKFSPPDLVEQVGVEYLRIQAPPMKMSYQVAPYKALRINGKDCWVRDVNIEETMNSVSINGKRITLERVAINRTVPNLGASKPAEFAPNAGQILLDRCSSNGDNIWHVATGARQVGPIVILNSTFHGQGHIEGHQRWTTGILLDNCCIPDGGIDFKNRGVMGSGHGWAVGWSVAWNCLAKSFVVQQPPGAYNWMIGCIGPNIPNPRPFDSGPDLPLGISDSPGKPVAPKSLYLTQLAERLGIQAVKNIGYSSPDDVGAVSNYLARVKKIKTVINKTVNKDFAKGMFVNTSNIRDGNRKYGGENAVDGNDKTYWATDDSVTHAILEVDTGGPVVINSAEMGEAEGFENRVKNYKVEGEVNSNWVLLSSGFNIGKDKIDRFPKVTVWKVRLIIQKASAYPAIRRFSIFLKKISGKN